MKNLIYILVSFALLQSCAPTTHITGSWKSPNYPQPDTKFKKMFIAVMAQDIEFRDNLEKDIAKVAQSRGLQTSLSLDIFPPNMTKSQLPPKEEVEKIIAKTASDLVMVVAVKDVKEQTRYVPGSTTTYAPYGYGGYYGYYGGGMAYSYSPGYYTTDKTIYLETNLYNLVKDEIIWSAQSTTTNPSDFKTFSRDFTYAVLERLKKDGLIK